MATVKAKASSRDTIGKLIAAISRSRPKTDAHGDFEVSRFGRGETLSKVRYVLNTGIESFDQLTGRIPFGRITEIYGLESSGKTALVMRAAVQAQLRNIIDLETGDLVGDDVDVTTLYIDNEQSIDDDDKLVIDGTEITGVLCRCDTVDQIFKICEITLDQLEKIEKETKRTQLLLIVVDTIAGTSSKEEMAADWVKEDYDRRAKSLRRGFRRLMRRISSRNVAMICTNQISDSYAPKQTKGRPTLPQDADFTTAGGRAVKFFARLRVFVYAINKNYKLVKKTKFAAGFSAGFHVSKAARVKPNREGRFVLLYEGGLNNILSKFETMIMFKNFVSVNDEGVATLLFEKNGVTPKTFGNTDSTLEEDDEVVSTGRGRKANPYKLPEKYGWIPYYEAHKQDIDELWSKCVKYAFEIEGLNGTFQADEDDDEELLSSSEED